VAADPEMLRIEKGGAAQLADRDRRLRSDGAQGQRTHHDAFFEIPDPVRRDQFLRSIAASKKHIAIHVGPHVIRARPEAIWNARGKATARPARSNSPLRLHPGGGAAWREPQAQAMLVIDHPNYGHAAVIGRSAGRSLRGSVLRLDGAALRKAELHTTTTVNGSGAKAQDYLLPLLRPPNALGPRSR